MDWTISASVGCLFALAFVSCSTASEANRSLLKEHNRHRESRGLEPLVLDESLCEYAQDHAESMAAKGHLVHSSMSNLAAKAGNGNVAENIAWGQESEADVCDAWMKSTGHRTNMLGKRYKKVGFGVKQDERGRKYWCAVFSA